MTLPVWGSGKAADRQRVPRRDPLTLGQDKGQDGHSPESPGPPAPFLYISSQPSLLPKSEALVLPVSYLYLIRMSARTEAETALPSTPGIVDAQPV